MEADGTEPIQYGVEVRGQDRTHSDECPKEKKLSPAGKTNLPSLTWCVSTPSQ